MLTNNGGKGELRPEKGNCSNIKLDQGLKLRLTADAAFITTELGTGETSGLTPELA